MESSFLRDIIYINEEKTGDQEYPLLIPHVHDDARLTAEWIRKGAECGRNPLPFEFLSGPCFLRD